MAKVMIITHRSEASELLESLQTEGICQVLNAKDASVSRDLPEPAARSEKPKDIEQFLLRLADSIDFLKSYCTGAKDLVSILAPRIVIDEKMYNKAVSDKRLPVIVEKSLECKLSIEKAASESEKISEALKKLEPWVGLETPVEQLGWLQSSACFVGLVPTNQLEQLSEQLAELCAAIQAVGLTGDKAACLVVCLKDSAADVQKLLRSAEFEPVSFEGYTGTVKELITEHRKQLKQTRNKLQKLQQQAVELSENFLNLQILYDHYENLLKREQTKSEAPATDATVVLEGWIKRKDYKKLEKVVSLFGASSLSTVAPVEGEEVPVEIENKNFVRPFEVITRLYGMPRRIEVDPTVFLAPFFALFFGLCLTDAGYGLVLIAAMIFLIRKFQGDKKLMWMLGICGAITVVAGALTGGWFGDAIQQFLPALKPMRDSMVWFDPFERPMMFFGLSMALGYFQIQAGLLIALMHHLRRREFIEAVCDKLTWIVMLNSLLLFGAGKAGLVSAQTGGFFGKLALVPAAMILLFSHREGSAGSRIGMGAYNLFSTIFFVGDVLSYLRLMALGMVTAGIAMAVNVIAKISLDIPYGIGIVVMIMVLVGGHGFNLAMSGLGAFVHTLRLQYVEFFPKFFAGGGRQFQPLTKQYKNVYIKNDKAIPFS